MATHHDYMQEYIDLGQWDSIRENITASGVFPAIQQLGSSVVGVEIGIKEGMNSIAMLEMCPNIVKLTGIDPFSSYLDLGYQWSDEEQESIYQHMLKNVKIRQCDNRFEHVRKTSLDAVELFEDNSLDFVFIDGEHTSTMVTSELDAYWPKLRDGGIMSGHDFDKIGNAVRAWKTANDVKADIQHVAHTSWYFVK